VRSRFLGLPLDVLTAEETVRQVESLIDGGGVHQHVVLNASKVVQAQHDEELRSAIEACDIVNADGMSVVWAGRLLGIPVPERVAGIDLMERLLERAASRGWPVYFLGAQQAVVERVVEFETQRYADLRVAGYRNGYWTEAEEGSVVAEIAAASPVLLFVAMPSPKKEQFLVKHRDVIKAPFVMGVGGSFDVVAGVTRRAPVWMQRSGLEWAFRLKEEPRRMTKRYLVGNSKFIALVVKAWRSMGGRANHL
jgi:N-acetylglucosaminyldiphosphoundecaprenol N-acetyl-beta-D-mannosaminyltransferase